jgi:hypothetical protein
MMIITILGIEVKDDNVGEESQAREISQAKPSNSIASPAAATSIVLGFLASAHGKRAIIHQ